MDNKTRQAFFEFLLRIGDDRLVSGHRLSEWCGHAPILEEDIALANIALDNIGQASAFLHLAADVEGKGRDEDALAYLRNEREYRNCVLAELPKGDFGFTVMRQFLFSAYSLFLFEALQRSSHEDFAGISAKSCKEVRYHVRHCSEWVIRLGDGTDESHRRIQESLNDMWIYTADMFFSDSLEETLIASKIIPSLSGIKAQWDELLAKVLTEATLTLPQVTLPVASNGRLGRHTEYLGHMLAEMQIVARSHPGARW